MLPESGSQNTVEHLHVVDALAVVAAFAGQILIDIRDRQRVRVGANRIGENTREAGCRGARQTGTDAGLNDRVPTVDGLSVRGQPRPVERVSEGPTMRCAASRGSCVSASRVMTNRTPFSRARSPTCWSVAACRSALCPAAATLSPISRRLSSSSLPRFRSQPIQTCSLSLHRRRR